MWYTKEAIQNIVSTHKKMVRYLELNKKTSLNNEEQKEKNDILTQFMQKGTAVIQQLAHDRNGAFWTHNLHELADGFNMIVVNTGDDTKYKEFIQEISPLLKDIYYENADPKYNLS